MPIQESVVKQSIQKHENDIQCLIELLNNGSMFFCTGIQGSEAPWHRLSEPTQLLIDEALNLLLAERQKSASILRQSLANM